MPKFSDMPRHGEHVVTLARIAHDDANCKLTKLFLVSAEDESLARKRFTQAVHCPNDPYIAPTMLRGLFLAVQTLDTNAMPQGVRPQAQEPLDQTLPITILLDNK